MLNLNKAPGGEDKDSVLDLHLTTKNSLYAHCKNKKSESSKLANRKPGTLMTTYFYCSTYMVPGPRTGKKNPGPMCVGPTGERDRVLWGKC